MRTTTSSGAGPTAERRPLRRPVRTVAFVLVLAVAAGGCGGDGDGADGAASGAAVDDTTVVAVVEGTDVTVGDVRERLPAEPPIWVGGDPPEPAREAFDAAVRDALFAAEARRRGLVDAGAGGDAPAGADEAMAEALAVQALLADERERHDLGPEALDEDEARAAWLGRRDEFDDVESATVSYVHLADPAGAADVLAAGDLTGEAFRDAAGDLGTVRTATVQASGAGVPVPVARVVFDLRAEGAVGVVPGDEGGWYLARIDAIELHPLPWDDELATTVRTALAWEREQAHLERLGQRLAGGGDVVVRQAEVDAMLVAVGWGAPPEPSP